MEWISVVDRLPEDNKTNLVHSEEFGVLTAYLDNTNDYWWGYFEAEEYFNGQLWDVTHWMPLPEPPEA